MDLLSWICWFIVVSLLLILWTKQKSDCPRLPPDLPGKLPIIGHIYYFFGGTISISDPEDILLVSNTCLAKDCMYDIGKELMENGLANASLDIWRRHRKLLLPAYNQQVLDGRMPAFNKHSRILVDRLAEKVGKDTFDHIRVLEKTFVEISFETTMGLSEFQEDSVDKFLDAVMDFFQNCVLRKLISLVNERVYSWTPFKAQDEKIYQLIYNMANTVIKRKRDELARDSSANSSDKLKSVLDILLADGSLTDLEIRDEVITTILASYDSVSVTITYALVLIASNPVVQEKIFEELNNVFEGSDRDVEKEDLVNMKYLEAVLKETMRLYPVFPIVTRYIHEDVKLKKYTLPAGTNCAMALYAANRCPIWGPDAEAFRPERWFEENVPNHAFVAFSLGKRNCIGQKFAMMSMMTTLCHILRNYRIYGDHNKIVTKFLVIIKPASGHHIRIERRARNL